MLKVKSFKQNTSYSCGPTSLKIVLDYFGEKISEKTLIKLTGAKKEYGSDPDDLVRAAKTLGYNAIYKKNSSVPEIQKYLKKNIPVIVDWFSPTALGHYSVVVYIDNKKIIYSDPQFGKLKELDLREFENRWFELDEYPPKNQAKFSLRQITVVMPK